MVTDQQFKNALKLWASGVTIVTNQSDAGIKGMTATSFCSVSLNPPQILVCLNQASDTGTAIVNSGYFVVNLLKSGQEAMSNQFAGGSSQEQRFAEVSWHPGTSGSPVLDDALASLECRLVESISAGSHWVMIGEVQHVTCNDGEPLLYYHAAYRSLASVE